MKHIITKRIFIYLLLLLFTSIISLESSQNSIFSTKEMQAVMTFNIRYAVDSGDRAWEKRRPLVIDIIKQYQPIFLGTQEGLYEQIEDLKKDLPNYQAIGVSRRGNTEDEYSALFYDTNKANLVSSGNFWLSNTPNQASSMLEGTGHPRMVSWGEFKVDGIEHPVFVFNTHLALEEKVSSKQVDILIEKIDELSKNKKAEVIITGDFNIIRLSKVWKKFIKAGFKDAWQLASYQSGTDFSMHGWKGINAVSLLDSSEKAGYIIDWILQRGATIDPKYPLLVNIITDSKGDIYPSDHFPVVLTTLGETKSITKNVGVNKSKIKPDEELLINAQITNNGNKGMIATKLYLDNSEISIKWGVFDQNQTIPITFRSRIYKSGLHTFDINNTMLNKVEVLEVPSIFKYIDFLAPNYLKVKEKAIIKASLHNIGSIDGETIVNLMVNSKVESKKTIKILAGQNQVVNFSHKFAKSGIYKIEVGDKKTEIFVMEDFPKKWLFNKGDDLSWANSDFNDTLWQKVSLPMAWETHSNYVDDFVYGWYRLHFSVPTAWKGKDIRIIIGQIDDADQTFFNGKKIGETGSFPTSKGGFNTAWNVTRNYIIPSNLIKYGEDNVIAVRVYDATGGGGLHRGKIGFLAINND